MEYCTADTEVLRILVHFLLSSFLVISCFALALLLTQSVYRSVLSMIWNRLEDHFTWPSGSEFLPHGHGAEGFNRVKWVFDDGAQSTRLYERTAAPEGEHPVQCVFCLCDFEDGQEVRELRCEHLFHRSCLDRWVGYGRATCPLCRKSLVSKVAEAEFPCEQAVQLDQLFGTGAV